LEDSSLTHKVPDIDALLKLIEALRGENGCPWDKKQTPRSMASYLTEELYELLDAIELKGPEDVCEELGDLLFHIFFIARLFQEQGRFNIKDVVSVCIEKMIRRHPHVFGNQKIDSPDEVKKQWHRIKMAEKKTSHEEAIIDSVPTRLPALMRAYRLSERVAKTGFDWNTVDAVIEKLEEEISELKSALGGDKPASKDSHHTAMELGDILFTLVNVARFLNIQPESALRDATQKFERRFKRLEKMVAAGGREIDTLSAQEMNRYWEKAKKQAE